MPLDWGYSQVMSFHHTKPVLVSNHDSKICDSQLLGNSPDFTKIIRKYINSNERISTIITSSQKYSPRLDIYNLRHSDSSDSVLLKQRSLDSYCFITSDKEEYVATDVREWITRAEPPLKNIFSDKGILSYPEVTNNKKREIYLTEGWKEDDDSIRNAFGRFGDIVTVQNYEHRVPTQKYFLRCYLLRHAIWETASRFNKTGLGRSIKSYVLGPLDMWITDILVNGRITTNQIFFEMGSITRKELESYVDSRRIMTKSRLEKSRVNKKNDLDMGIVKKLAKNSNKAVSTFYKSRHQGYEKLEAQIRRMFPDDYEHQRHVPYVCDEILEDLYVLQNDYKCFELY